MENPKILVLDRSEELAERVRAITSEMNPLPEIVSCTKIGSASHVNHEHEGPFAVLISGPSLATKTGLRRLAMLHKESPTTSIVMSFDHRPEASLRDIIQVGADDMIELSGDDTSIKGAIKRALVRLTAADLTDGPWCPDAVNPNRFDADLLRLRTVAITLRVEATDPALRGPAGVLFSHSVSSRAATGSYSSVSGHPPAVTLAIGPCGTSHAPRSKRR